MTASPTSPRSRRHDRSEIPVSILPEGNPLAAWAYVFALTGLIPGLGILFGPLAILVGTVGLSRARRDELKRGLGHAYVSRILGLFEFAFNFAGFAMLGHGQGYW